MLCVFLPPLGKKNVGVGKQKERRGRLGWASFGLCIPDELIGQQLIFQQRHHPQFTKLTAFCLCLGCYCSFTVAFDEDALRHRRKPSELFCQSLCVFKLLQITFSRPGANYLISGDHKTILATCGLNPFKTLHLGFTL